MARVVDLHDFQNRVNVWWIKRRRYWIHTVDPIGPSEPMITEAGAFMETESDSVMVTEGV